MTDDNEDDATSAMRQRLMTADEVYVYKIPTLKSSGGHRAEDWNLAEPLKTCTFLVERRGDTLVLEFLLLEAEGGSVFCQATFDAKTQKAAQFLEPAVDSSRYFVVKISSDTGRQAYIGFGFREREKATDLRESLDHYEKSMQREQAAPTQNDFHIPQLEQGEQIHAHVAGKKGKSTVVKKKEGKGGGGGVPLLSKKPPPSADEDATKKVEKMTISMDGIDLNATASAGGGDGSDDDSGGAVYEGDDEQWKTEFDTK